VEAEMKTVGCQNIEGLLVFTVYLVMWSAYAALLVGCARTGPTSSDRQFESVVGAKLDPQLQVVTGKPQYARNEYFTYEVENHSAVPVYFQDQSFGVRAFELDDQSQKWGQVSWNFELVSPEQVTVAPGPNQWPDGFFGIPLKLLMASGRVRIVVTGWTDRENPNDSLVAAYKEIEIAP
jgi:hypothetical protein